MLGKITAIAFNSKPPAALRQEHCQETTVIKLIEK